MFSPNKTQHALITIYGDNEARNVNKTISLFSPDREIKILEPTDEDMLENAAANSVLVFIGLNGPDDPALRLGRKLQDNRMVVADIMAYDLSAEGIPYMEVLGKGFDNLIKPESTETLEFKKFLSSKIAKGIRRLEGLILEEEYRRLNDALSIVPVSMIIFDNEKRAVFVSDHYYRAYPKIAPRLIRGLRVYDAFEMMAQEEGLTSDDPRYERIRQFWLNLDGKIEFTLDDGVSYRLKAIKLPGNRGTIITGQNITNYKKD